MRLFNLLCVVALAVITLSCDQKPPSSPGPTETPGYEGLSVQATSLLAVIQDEATDGQVRMEAIYKLGELKDPNSFQLLEDLLRQDMNERTGIWAAAIPALGELGKPEAVPILLEALNKRDDDWLGREMAAQALGCIADPGSVNALIASAHFFDTRESAIRALVQTGDVRATDVFIEALDETEDIETVEAARAGLLKIGGAALPALQKELNQYSKEYPNTYRRNKVEQIIKEID